MYRGKNDDNTVSHRQYLQQNWIIKYPREPQTEATGGEVQSPKVGTRHIPGGQTHMQVTHPHTENNKNA